MIPISKSAYELMHRGALALANVEANGMRIDVPYLDKTIQEVDKRIQKFTGLLKQHKIYRTWSRTYGKRAALGSRAQLAHVLFDVMGYPCQSRTKTGRPSMDGSNLERLDLKFVKRYLEVEKLKKLLGTYLKGIKREVVLGRLHPFFNLHLVSTYRSSSSSPNFQNIPIRDKLIGKLVRRAFIPAHPQRTDRVQFEWWLPNDPRNSGSLMRAHGLHVVEASCRMQRRLPCVSCSRNRSG